jgi:hypothetical protein
MSESKKYAIGSIVLGILSFYWETALFGLFLGIAGILFSGYFTVQEIFFAACLPNCNYALILPTCAYGLIMYVAITAVSLKKIEFD